MHFLVESVCYKVKGRPPGTLTSVKPRARRSPIRNDVDRAREEPYASVAGATPDIGDQAVADLIADTGEAEITRDLGELRALEAALKRVADGTYGLCADCGEDIPFARLNAQPGAGRCFACQQRHEKTYRT